MANESARFQKPTADRGDASAPGTGASLSSVISTETRPEPLVDPQIHPLRQSRRGLVVRGIYVAALIVADALAIALAFLVAYHVRASMEQRPNRVAPLSDYLATLGFEIVALLATFALMRLYLPQRGRTHTDQLGAIFRAVTTGNVIAMALAAARQRGIDMPLDMLIYAWALSILFVWVIRSIVEQAMRLARTAGLDPESVLIVGAGREGRTILHKVRSDRSLGYTVVGFIDTVHEPDTLVDRPGSPVALPAPPIDPDPSAPPILGALTELPRILQESGAREIVVADPELTHVEVLDIVAVCDRARVNVKVFPDVFQLVVREVGVSELGGLPMLRVRDVNLRGWNLLLKRALDIVLSSVLLVLLSPVMLLVALAVKLTSPNGPVFFVQERVGVDGRPFACVKFRSMHPDAEATTGPVWALPGDERTTCLGPWLRHYSIDELPQLVNVLIGDMSLVGPRPERPYFVEQFRRFIPRYEKRHQEKAGVTGWAQVNGLRGQSPIEERTLYDLFYVEHWSPAFDLKILIQTVAAVFRGRNAY